jgi:hypothetical protein
MDLYMTGRIIVNPVSNGTISAFPHGMLGYRSHSYVR